MFEGWGIAATLYLYATHRPRSRNDVKNDRSMQLTWLTDTCCRCMLQKWAPFWIFISFYNPFDLIYNSHLGLTVYYVTFGNTPHLSVACFCVNNRIFNQVLANTLKLCQTNCPKYIHGDFFPEALWSILIQKNNKWCILPFFPTNGQITGSTTRIKEPGNTIYRSNALSMVDQRLWRWPNIGPLLDPCLLFAYILLSLDLEC